LTLQNYSLSEFKNFDYETITYENLISDYFLTWGESSKNLLSDYIDKKKLILVGNPIYGKIEKSKNKSFKPKTCVVYLSHYKFDKSNLNLIDLVARFAKNHKKIKFYFSAHPDSNLKIFKERMRGNMELLPKGFDKDKSMKMGDFFILHNSSIFIEGLSAQVPIFRFDDEFSLLKHVPENSFKNLNQLESIFSKMSKGKNYTNYINSCYKFYNKNFYQPKISIPEYYKKKILELI